ncbi:MAG TPA: NADPH-dependent FMN reductase [Cytophagales bacterium]|nr:NADPH-dependent FMN reductase [Cytophagales bacterium]
MITIISGTNRTNSLSLEVSRYYKAILDDAGTASQILDLSQLPTDFAFSALYANGGKNEKFNTFRSIIEESQKFIFVVPEYNGSFPGVLKAFIDGLKYPDSFSGKKALLVGISSGIQGSTLALSHLNDILNYLNMHVYGTRLKIPMVEKNFTNGVITDAKILDLAQAQLKGFLKF